MSKKKHVKSIALVVDNELCTSCGACTHICPFGNIFMLLHERQGRWDAQILDINRCFFCNGEKNCLSVCPSAGVDYMSLGHSDQNHLLGMIKNIYNGFSADTHRRFNSSSGGFIRDLCESLLEQGEIAGVLSITHQEGLEYVPDIVTDISRMPNSVYHNVNFQNAVPLLKNASGKYLLIGLPCQITSIELLSQKKKMQFLKEKIYGKIALICGYTFDRCNALAFGKYNRFNIGQISYRELGRYRKTRITNEQRSLVFDVRSPKNVNEHINNMLMSDRFLVQTACLYCVDHIAYFADLVVGDAWQRRYSEDSIGTNLIISRTDVGEAIIDKMRGFNFDAGYLDEIIEAQSSCYALGSIGEAMKVMSHRGFHPQHRRTENQKDILTHRLKLTDSIKIKIVKRLLRHEHFYLARALYIALVSGALLKSHFIKRLKGSIK